MYGINPYAPVNPAMAGVTQQRLANYQSQMPQMSTYQPQQFVPQPPMPLMMKGRTVASLDEVKAAQIDLDGSLTYFPCPADSCIYAKYIDMNGMPVIQNYKLSLEKEPVPKRYADVLGSDVGTYVKMAKAYMEDPDAAEGKVFCTWLGQMRRKEE